MGYSRTIKI